MKDKLRDRVAGVLSLGNSAKTLIEYALAGEKALRLLPELLAILDTEGDGGAVGEKVCIDAVGRVEMDMTGDIGINWVLEGGIHALEEGTWILCADREITDDEGYGELYTRPARSGVVSDEDVRDAERWRYLVRENNKGGRGAFRIVWFDEPGDGFITTDGVSVDGKDEQAIVRIVDAAIQGERHER